MIRLLFVFLGSVLFFSSFEVAAKDTKRDIILQRRERNRDCQTNLSALYECLKFYASRNNGKLPSKNNAAGLLELLKYEATYKYFQCDAARTKKIRRAKDLQAENIPYIYFGGINLNSARKQCPKLIIMADRPDSRHLFVLLADGTVTEITGKKTKRKISNCTDLVEAMNDIYKYPASILNALRSKAKAMDNQLDLK